MKCPVALATVFGALSTEILFSGCCRQQKLGREFAPCESIPLLSGEANEESWVGGGQNEQ
jgi:hypothetical protein